MSALYLDASAEEQGPDRVRLLRRRSTAARRPAEAELPHLPPSSPLLPSSVSPSLPGGGRAGPDAAVRGKVRDPAQRQEDWRLERWSTPLPELHFLPLHRRPHPPRPLPPLLRIDLRPRPSASASHPDALPLLVRVDHARPRRWRHDVVVCEYLPADAIYLADIRRARARILT